MTTPQPTENALAARRILRTDALPSLAKRLKTRGGYIDEVAGVLAEHVGEQLRPPEPRSGGWTLLRVGIGLVSNAATIIPAPEDGGPQRSFTTGALIAAMVAAVAGDQLLRDDPVADPETETEADAGWDPPGSLATTLPAAAAGLAGELLDPVASPESRTRFAAELTGQLDVDVPGVDHRPAALTLCVAGTWLAGNAAPVTAPVSNSGVIRKKPNSAPAGCGFAGALIAQVGVTLLAR